MQPARKLPIIRTKEALCTNKVRSVFSLADRVAEIISMHDMVIVVVIWMKEVALTCQRRLMYHHHSQIIFRRRKQSVQYAKVVTSLHEHAYAHHYQNSHCIHSFKEVEL